MFANFQRPVYRPAINIGCLFDISSGRYVKGHKGQMILEGGLHQLTGIVSRPNNFKTALMIYMAAMARRAFPKSNTLIYDSEGTLDPISRFVSLAPRFPELAEIDFNNDEQLVFTDLSRYSGDQFFEVLKTAIDPIAKNQEKYMVSSPIVDKDNKPKRFIYPSICSMDSFSNTQITQVIQMYEKNAVGSSGNNTDAMTMGKAKAQLFNQLPNICSKTGLYMILTAHISDVINIEMYPTDKRNLSHMKKDTKLKGVGPGFYSLPHNVFSVEKNTVLQNDKKFPLYPKDNATAMEGDTDLKILEIINLRGKAGITGLPFHIIVSQTDGIKPELTNFHYCKKHEYGIGGNLQNYYLELMPEVSLSRTKVHAKLEENPKLARAAEIQAEMLQLIQFQRWTSDVVCSPKELYEDLKAIGYDWDQLLETKGYWMCIEDAQEYNHRELSTYDLLRMRLGLYVPYWMTDEERSKLDLTKAKLTPTA